VLYPRGCPSRATNYERDNDSLQTEITFKKCYGNISGTSL
jgi:hypothetical protein